MGSDTAAGGVNEELFSRGLVLGRLQRAYRPSVAVGPTAALFGVLLLRGLPERIDES